MGSRTRKGNYALVHRMIASLKDPNQLASTVENMILTRPGERTKEENDILHTALANPHTNKATLDSAMSKESIYESYERDTTALNIIEKSMKRMLRVAENAVKPNNQNAQLSA